MLKTYPLILVLISPIAFSEENVDKTMQKPIAAVMCNAYSNILIDNKQQKYKQKSKKLFNVYLDSMAEYLDTPDGKRRMKEMKSAYGDKVSNEFFSGAMFSGIMHETRKIIEQKTDFQSTGKIIPYNEAIKTWAIEAESKYNQANCELMI